MNSLAEPYDFCIVGAGVAGSALGIQLGRLGYRVVIIERNWSEPDEIIGELLQPSGVQILQQGGMMGAVENIDAQPIYGYAMKLNQQFIQLDYDHLTTSQGPTGLGFRYGRFVQRLRTMASSHSSVTCLSGTARNLIKNSRNEVTGVTYQDPDGRHLSIDSQLTIISQGSLSSLRKPLNQAKIRMKGYMLGLILTDCSLPFAFHGHVIMANPAPILIYPISSNKYRILIDFPRDMPVLKGADLTSYLRENITPQLPSELQHAFLHAVKAGRFKAKSTSLLPSRPVLQPGALLIGDSLNMRHPTTGGGMTVALTDVMDLIEVLHGIDLKNKKEQLEAIRKFYRNRHRKNATVNVLAYALYRVFRHETLRQACFDYLKKGGTFAAEPMAILSGISRNRWTLVKHFFAVAGFAIKKQNRYVSTGNFFTNSCGLLRDSVQIIFPLILDEIPRTYRNHHKNHLKKQLAPN